jgi:chromosome segregation ATPase
MRAESQAKHSEHDSLKPTNKTLSELVEKQAEDIKAKEQRIAAMSAELGGVGKESSRLAELTENLKEEVGILQREKDLMTKEIEKYARASSSSTSKSQELEGQIGRLKASVEHLEMTGKQQISLLMTKEQQLKDSDFLLTKAKDEITQLNVGWSDVIKKARVALISYYQPADKLRSCLENSFKRPTLKLGTRAEQGEAAGCSHSSVKTAQRPAGAARHFEEN